MTTVAAALKERVESLIETSSSIPVIGLSGPQGSGKSTALRGVLESSTYNIAGLGLDDFYLSKSDRELLAQTISPLFETRGPPGTHDISLLQTILEELLSLSVGSISKIPKFDKPSDDRVRPEDWKQFRGKPDAVIIEGWMIGATLPADFLTSPPINDIEKSDVNGAWRQAQHEALSIVYSDLWNRIDSFIHITGPGFDAVHDWRLEQEASNLGIDIDALPEMRREWVASFIQYFERLTKSMHEGHTRPGTVLQIDTARKLVAVKT